MLSLEGPSCKDRAEANEMKMTKIPVGFLGWDREEQNDLLKGKDIGGRISWDVENINTTTSRCQEESKNPLEVGDVNKNDWNIYDRVERFFDSEGLHIVSLKEEKSLKATMSLASVCSPLQQNTNCYAICDEIHNKSLTLPSFLVKRLSQQNLKGKQIVINSWSGLPQSEGRNRNIQTPMYEATLMTNTTSEKYKISCILGKDLSQPLEPIQHNTRRKNFETGSTEIDSSNNSAASLETGSTKRIRTEPIKKGSWFPGEIVPPKKFSKGNQVDVKDLKIPVNIKFEGKDKNQELFHQTLSLETNNFSEEVICNGQTIVAQQPVNLKKDFSGESIAQTEIKSPRDRELVRSNQGKNSNQKILSSHCNKIEMLNKMDKMEINPFCYDLFRIKNISRIVYLTYYQELYSRIIKLWTALSRNIVDSFIGNAPSNNNDDQDDKPRSLIDSLNHILNINPDFNKNSMDEESLIQHSKAPPDKGINANGSQGSGSNHQLLDTKPPDPIGCLHKVSKRKPPDKKIFLPKDYPRKLFALIRGIETTRLGLSDDKIREFKKKLEPLLQEQSAYRPLFDWVEQLLADNNKLLKHLHKKREEYSQDFKRIKEHGKINMELIKDYNSLKKFKEEGEAEKYIACRALVKLGLEIIPQEDESSLFQHEIEGRHAHFLFWIITTDQKFKNSLCFFSLEARELLYSTLKEIDSILEKKRLNLDHQRQQELEEAFRTIKGIQGHEQIMNEGNVSSEEHFTYPGSLWSTLNSSSPESNISIIIRQDKLLNFVMSENETLFSREIPIDDRMDNLELAISKKLKTEDLSRFL